MAQLLDLEQYKTRPIEADLGELNRLNGLLKELDRTAFKVEELPKQILLYQKALYTYPQLSTEFLSMYNELKVEDRWGGYKSIIKVPKFGVYRLNNPVMRIGLDRRTWVSIPGGVHGTEDEYRAIINPELPEIIEKPLIKSLEIFTEEYEKDEGWYIFVNDEIPKNIKKIYRKLGSIEISSTFYGLIPTEVKEEIYTASKIFSRDIFLVVETKPEEWNVRRIVTDPLLVGVVNNACFYINKFETTPLEEYVKMEFTS